MTSPQVSSSSIATATKSVSERADALTDFLDWPAAAIRPGEDLVRL